MNVLITGSSKGIGEALSLHYLKSGHNVLGISRTVSEETQKFSSYQHIFADFSDLDNLEKIFDDSLNEIEDLDLVVLNAGVLGKVADMKDSSIQEIKHVMDVNVWSNKILIDSLIENIAEIKQIVGISSGAAVSGNRGWNSYSISKAALNMLVDLYSKELTNTHISALAPGIIDTQMQDYVASIKNVENYPTMQRLQAAKGTDDMPPPHKVADKLAEAFENLYSFPSGSFADVRNM